MTAPTVPTAPLPSLLPCPFCGGEESTHTPECYYVLEDEEAPFPEIIAAWNTRSDAALLTMQRERDDLTVHVADLRESLDERSNDLDAKIEIIDALREQLAASERTCAELRERIAKYRARLEVDHHWRGTEVPGQLVRVDNPPDVDETYDGIACRDATIKLGDEAYKEMKARAEAAERTVEGCASINDLSPEAIERHIAQNPQLLGSTIDLLRALAARISTAPKPEGC